MTKTYPQETLGTTLLDITHANERRRVYAHGRAGYLEVGEFTQGPLTQALYEWPVHLHSIHLSADFPLEDVRQYFCLGEPYLADYMDELDTRHIPYGYLNSVMNKYVSFRPAKPQVRY